MKRLLVLGLALAVAGTMSLNAQNVKNAEQKSAQTTATAVDQKTMDKHHACKDGDQKLQCKHASADKKCYTDTQKKAAASGNHQRCKDSQKKSAACDKKDCKNEQMKEKASNKKCCNDAAKTGDKKCSKKCDKAKATK